MLFIYNTDIINKKLYVLYSKTIINAYENNINNF